MDYEGPEQRVVGAMLVDPDCVDRILAEVEPDLFVPTGNGHTIFEACRQLREQGHDVDAATVAQHLTMTGQISAASEVEHWLLESLHVPTSGHADTYIDQLRQSSRLRRLRNLHADIGHALERGAAIDTIEQQLSDFGQSSASSVAIDANWMDFDTFMARDCKSEFYANNLMVARQDCMIGGPSKSLKTGALADLAVSLASGQPVFGHFEVPKALTVVCLSGESGESKLQRTMRNIANCRGGHPSKLIVDFALPPPCPTRNTFGALSGPSRSVASTS
jgi:hypothetical protein